MQSELDAVWFRAQQAGVQRALVVGYDLPSSERAVNLAENKPALFACVGVHPHDAHSATNETLAQIESLAKHPKVMAIGEIGLDFYRDLSPRSAQYEAFRAQMQLAQTLNLPVVIHCREAYDEVLSILSEFPKVKGVLHCFSGTAEHAERGLALGYYLGIGGVVTFKSAESLRQIVRTMPQDRLLLETDAPYLAPHPYRGKRNEPAYIPLIARQVAELWGISLDALSKLTESNAEALFPKVG